MNWLDKILKNISSKLGLIITLLALILFRCEEPTELGQDLIPGNDTVGVYSVELPVTTKVILRDSIWTQSRLVQAGDYTDPVFGRVIAEGYSNLLSSTNTRPTGITDSTVYDSLTVTLKIDALYGSNVFNPYDLEIYQLLDSIRSGYTDAFSFNRQPLGNLLADTSIQVNKTLYEKDTFYVRIKLSDVLGQALYDSAAVNPDVFINGLKTLQAFKGLAFVPGDNTGTVFGFDMDDSFVHLHYHHPSDTLSYRLGLGNFSYSWLTADRSGTPLMHVNQPDVAYEVTDHAAYIQNGLGISTFLDLTSYKELKTSVGNLVINNATLYVESESYDNYLNPLSTINIAVADSAGNMSCIVDTVTIERKDSTIVQISKRYHTIDPNGLVAFEYASNSQSLLPSPFITSKKRYHIDVTRFLQQEGGEGLNRLYLLLNPPINMRMFKETPLLYIPVITGETSLKRFLAGNGKIKLKVYYTALK